MTTTVLPELSLAQATSLRPKQKTSAEVIVVGGGLGGLQAAYKAQKSGLTCLVLEREDFLAGAETGRRAHDFGIDDTLHPGVMSMLDELRVTSDLLEERKDHHALCPTGDLSSLLDANDRRSFTRVRDNLETLSQKVDINKPSQMFPQFGRMTVKELARSHSATTAVLALADNWTQSLFGVSADKVAALTFLLHCKTHGGFRQALEGSGKWELRDGLHEAIVERLHPGSVILSKQLERIDQHSRNKVILTTNDGDRLQCTKVIMALPLCEYGEVDISPEVSQDKKWLWAAGLLEETKCLPIPAANLKNLEQDQWRQEENIHFAGSETSYAWRGHIEGALAAGSRAIDEVLEQLRPHTEALSARL